jgi:hypothetical protein
MEPKHGQFDRNQARLMDRGFRMMSRAACRWARFPTRGSLEEDQADQDDDYNPGNCIRRNQAIPQLAAGNVARFQWRSTRIGTSNRRPLRHGDPRYRRASGFRRFLPLPIRRFLGLSKWGGHENACGKCLWRTEATIRSKKYKMSFSFE